MMVVLGTLKDILTVTFKQRHDSYSDQFNRIFMTKMLLIASIVIGVDYFSDQVNCMIPKDARHSKEFFNAACWITGFYIFDEMTTRLHESAYYGIPRRVDYDGINRLTNDLCQTRNQHAGRVLDCLPMTKVYYLHFQWMPVYMGSLSMLFYLPYVAFRIANSDLISLKKELKRPTDDTNQIIRNYFNYSVNSLCQLRVRIWWNVMVKLAYVFLGLSTFYITDYLLMGKYLTFGTDYLTWYQQNNTLRHVHVRNSVRANAGNALLPSMGYCDIHEASLETRIIFHNENKFVCEISPHILYQYVLMVLWFLFVTSIVISIIGALVYVGKHLRQMLPYGYHCDDYKLIRPALTLREIEYLDVIKKKNKMKYSAVLKRLKEQRLHLNETCDYTICTNGIDKSISTFIL